MALSTSAGTTTERGWDIMTQHLISIEDLRRDRAALRLLASRLADKNVGVVMCGGIWTVLPFMTCSNGMP